MWLTKIFRSLACKLMEPAVVGGQLPVDPAAATNQPAVEPAAVGSQLPTPLAVCQFYPGLDLATFFSGGKVLQPNSVSYGEWLTVVPPWDDEPMPPATGEYFPPPGTYLMAVVDVTVKELGIGPHYFATVFFDSTNRRCTKVWSTNGEPGQTSSFRAFFMAPARAVRSETRLIDRTEYEAGTRRLHGQAGQDTGDQGQL
jgi:hypothetical protein